MHPKPDSTRAPTDVAEFVTDLDGGQFKAQLSTALSLVAAKVVDLERKGKVRIDLEIERISGTSQVRIAHTVKFEHPTSTGKAGEETGGATVMHVGRFGNKPHGGRQARIRAEACRQAGDRL